MPADAGRPLGRHRSNVVLRQEPCLTGYFQSRPIGSATPAPTFSRGGHLAVLEIKNVIVRRFRTQSGHCSHKSSKLYFILNNIKSCTLSDSSVTCHSSLNNASERSASIANAKAQRSSRHS